MSIVIIVHKKNIRMIGPVCMHNHLPTDKHEHEPMQTHNLTHDCLEVIIKTTPVIGKNKQRHTKVKQTHTQRG